MEDSWLSIAKDIANSFLGALPSGAAVTALLIAMALSLLAKTVDILLPMIINFVRDRKKREARLQLENRLEGIQNRLEKINIEKEIKITLIKSQAITLGLIEGQIRRVHEDFHLEIERLELQKKHVLERLGSLK